ncbi:MAG: TAXI family TRAP transporter solute-binding subunit [Proteobacteria bacterium]|nr:TAXI family TRAP transporter solute-binding subunit [Pseudomonadota bacterium]
MKALRVFLVVSLAVALAACTRAPDDETLKKDLQTLIEAGFAPGLLEVVSAQHTRVLPYIWPGDKLRVGYDAALRVKRDHRFGAWDQINIATLALLMDAAPDQIRGVKPNGNSSGDMISVRGGLAYLNNGDTLKLDTTPPEAAPKKEPGFVLASDIRDGVKRRIANLEKAWRASRAAISYDEWKLARRAVAGRAARHDGGFSIATDVEGSVYWHLGDAVARTASNINVPFANVATRGPQEALDFLRDGRVTAIVMRNTEAALAASGMAPYADTGPYKLEALAALYPEPVHVIVKEGSPIGSPAELFGKHVGVAGTARVDAVEAEAVLRGHGVPLSALAAPLVAVPTADALDQLEAGAFDALIVTAPLPSVPLRSFAARRPIRLLPFDSDAIAFLTTGMANYVAITIPARTYPGQTRPLAAVAAVTMLVSVNTVPAKEAASLLDLMLTRVDYLPLGSLTGAMVGREDAYRSMTLPWHAGAAAYFDATAKQ